MLTAGTRLGPYEITGSLGAGGMGEVYRARDARLGRDVAVKALPASSVNDPERIARFEREAQILAGLNHPHIAALFGLEESSSSIDGKPQRSQFLIMELVEGGTLAERLKTGPLEVRDALAVARQVADALQAAHDRGIIHRDLKPANIAFTPEGHAKILDFGLAKAFVAPDDATVAPATQSGVVLGTAAYMSPEQARGLPLDKRTDIFAFGCVLYEMLTGRNPFGAATVSDIIVGILGREPDWTALPDATPLRVRWLLRRCLEKDPRRRLHDIADARIELDEAFSEPADAGPPLPAQPQRTARPNVREVAAWLTTAALAVLVGVLVFRNQQAPTRDEGRTFRTIVTLPDRLRFFVDPASRFALSPDGTKMALVAAAAGSPSMLWIRPLDSLVAQPLPGTEGGIYPFWSPDSRFLGFIAQTESENLVVRSQLKKIDVNGGQPISLADTSFFATGAWSRDNVILFTPAGNSSLHRVSASGGPVSQVTTLDSANGDVQHSYPSFLPDGRRFLYTRIGRTGAATEPRAVYIGSLDAKEPPRLLLEGIAHAKYADGHLIFLRGSTLVAQEFDLERLELRGDATPLAERVQLAGGAGTGGVAPGAFSISDRGLLAYQTSSTIRSQPSWFDRSGKPIGTLGEPADYADLVLSPDGGKVAASVMDVHLGTRDVWIFDVSRGVRERFTYDPGDDFAPVWSPRAERLIFSSNRKEQIGLYVKRAGRTDTETRIEDAGLALGKYASHWSPDGKWILFIAGGRTIARSDVMFLPVLGGKPEAFLESGFVETQARFSPDGAWIAYVSNESGRTEVYVQPFPGRGEAKRVSTNGGRWPQWRRDGTEIFFVAPDNMLMSAAVTSSAGDFRVREIRPLFRLNPSPMVRLDAFPYDVTADGSRFLVNTFVEMTTPAGVTLVQNWLNALKK